MRVDVESVSLELIEDDDRICAHLRKSGVFEPDSLRTWHDLCLNNAGAQVLDVGGYSGLYTIVAALLGCHVTVVEPMPDQFRRIIENVALNGVSHRVRLVQAAAHHHGGSSVIRYNPKVKMTSGASMGRKSGAEVPVRLCTVDDLMAGCKVVAAKIDVERHEASVLMGSLQTLKRCHPTLIVEALDPPLRQSVEMTVPSYMVERVMDSRNLLMVPRR